MRVAAAERTHRAILRNADQAHQRASTKLSCCDNLVNTYKWQVVAFHEKAGKKTTWAVWRLLLLIPEQMQKT
jgi:hypothetical protein